MNVREMAEALVAAIAAGWKTGPVEPWRGAAVVAVAQALPALLERHLQSAWAQEAPLSPEALGKIRRRMVEGRSFTGRDLEADALVRHADHLQLLVAAMANDSEAYRRGVEAGLREAAALLEAENEENYDPVLPLMVERIFARVSPPAPAG